MHPLYLTRDVCKYLKNMNMFILLPRISAMKCTWHFLMYAILFHQLTISTPLYTFLQLFLHKSTTVYVDFTSLLIYSFKLYADVPWPDRGDGTFHKSDGFDVPESIYEILAIQLCLKVRCISAVSVVPVLISVFWTFQLSRPTWTASCSDSTSHPASSWKPWTDSWPMTIRRSPWFSLCTAGPALGRTLSVSSLQKIFIEREWTASLSTFSHLNSTFRTPVNWRPTRYDGSWVEKNPYF